MLPENMTIRPVLLDDAQALLRLRLEALQDSPEAFGEDYDYAAAQPYSIWADLVAHSLGEGDRVIFISEVQGKLVGMAGVNRSPMKNTRHSGSVWGVYVQPAWRGQGVATALVQACIDWGKRKGLATLRLGVITDNLTAIHCYENCGFRSCGVDPKAFYVKDRYYNLMRMTLVLEP
jgi:RimJ/RimL family protein N-acetyltransferase